MDLFSLVARLTLDKSDYDSGIDEAKGSAESFGSKLKSGLGTAAKVGGAAIAAASTAAVAFGKQAIDAGMTFDSSMSQVAATMGYSVEELNTQGSEAAQTFETLRNFAQEMGSATAFSASESADALNYMALAGYDAETSMQMLPNVLNLAAAGGIGLAQASDMVTDAQSALGLTLDETSEMVDKMAKASSQSNTSVAQLGEAFLTIGGTAKNLTGGTTELATALGILADNGIKGSEGGTALRNILLNLTPQSEDAAKAFEQIGLKAYDANGEMRPLADIFGDMNKAMANMTTEERQNILSNIFNKVDLKSVNALLATTNERWVELAGAIDDSAGAAQNMADTQLDNLAGDITLFQSAMEGARIAISDGLTPTLREFVQYGASGISTLTTAFKEKGIAGAMGALGTLISDGLAMVMGMLPQIVDAGVQLLMALTNGIIENLPLLADAALQIIMSLAQSLADNLPTLIPTIVQVVLQIVDTLTQPDTLANLVEAAVQIIVALAEGLIDALPRLIEKAPTIILNLVEALIKSAPKVLEAGVKLIGELARGIAQSVGTVVSAIGQIGKGIVDNITGVVSGAANWGKDMINNFVSGIKEKWESLKSSVKKVAQTVKDFLGFSEPEEGPLSNFHTYAPDMMQLFARGIEDNEHLITDAINGAFSFGPTITQNAAGQEFSVPRGNAGSSGSTRPLVLVIDGRELARIELPYFRAEEQRIGVQLAGV